MDQLQKRDQQQSPQNGDVADSTQSIRRSAYETALETARDAQLQAQRIDLQRTLRQSQLPVGETAVKASVKLSAGPAEPVPEYSAKQLRELERKRKHALADGKKLTPNANEQTAEIAESLRLSGAGFADESFPLPETVGSVGTTLSREALAAFLPAFRTDKKAESEQEKRRQAQADALYLQYVEPDQMSMDGITFAREAMLNNLTDTLLSTELTADMFAPARFAENAPRLLNCVSRFRHIRELIDDNPEYFSVMQTKDPLKYAGILRCIDLAVPLEKAAQQAMNAAGLQLDGSACQDAKAVKQARETMQQGLGELQQALKKSSDARDAMISSQLDELLDTKLAVIEAPEKDALDKRVAADPGLIGLYPDGMTGSIACLDLEEMLGFIERNSKSYDEHSDVALPLFKEYEKLLTAEDALRRRRAAMDAASQEIFRDSQAGAAPGGPSAPPTPAELLKNHRPGEYRRLCELTEKRADELTAQQNAVSQRVTALQLALQRLIGGGKPSLDEELTLQQFGYLSPDLQADIDACEKDAHLEKDTLAAQSAILSSHAAVPDYPANESKELQERQFMPQAHTLLWLDDDDKNVEIIDFVQRFEQASRAAVSTSGPNTEIAPIDKALFEEGIENLEPLVTRVVDCDVDALTALTPEKLLEKRDELAEITRPLALVNRMLDVVGEGGTSLRYVILAGRTDEYELKSNLLLHLTEKARAASLLQLSRFRPLQAADLTERDAAAGATSGERAQYAQRMLGDADILLRGDRERYRLRTTPETPEFIAKIRAFRDTQLSTGKINNFVHEAVDKELYEAVRRLEAGETEGFDREAANTVLHLKANNYQIAGQQPGEPGFRWTYNDASALENRHDGTGEPLLRSNDSFSALSGDLSDEEYRAALLDLGAGYQMKAGVTEPEKLLDAQERNRRGLRVWKEGQRIHYHQLAAKYGTSLERMSSQEFYQHYYEIKRDVQSIQTDTNILACLPGVFDEKLPEDVELVNLIEYFSTLAPNINTRLFYINGDMTEDEIREMQAESRAAFTGYNEARAYLVEHGLITDKSDWQAKPIERRRLEPEEEAAGAAIHSQKLHAARLEGLKRNPAFSQRIAGSALAEKFAGLLDADSAQENVDIFDFALRCEAADKLDRPLCQEAMLRLRPRVQKVLDADTDALLALTDEQLAARQDELLRLTADGEAVSALLKLKQDTVESKTYDVKSDLELPLLREDAGLYHDKLRILQTLAQKARAISLTALSKKEGLRADLFTEDENVYELSGEQRAARAANLYMQSDETLQRLKENYARHRADDADPASNRFAHNCRVRLALENQRTEEAAGDRLAGLRIDYRQLSAHGPVTAEGRHILKHVTGENYSVSGEASGLTEAFFRTGPTLLAALPAAEKYTDDQLLDMLRDLAARPNSAEDITEDMAKQQNLRGLAAYRELMRINYDYLARKYGSGLETLSIAETYRRFPELSRDLSSLEQTHDHFLQHYPQLFDMDSEADRTLAGRIKYYSVIEAIVRNRLLLPAAYAPVAEIQKNEASNLKVIAADANVARLVKQGDLHPDIRWDEKV